MDGVLERLWTLANRDVALATDGEAAPSRPQHDRGLHTNQELIIAEAQALWRTLETLVATLRACELSVGDPAFTKLLACARTVLSDPASWCATDAKGNNPYDKSVLVLATRVLVTLACRGDRERDALARDGIVTLLLEAMRSERDSALAASAGLHVLQTLAFDAQNRVALDAAGALPVAIALLQQHTHDAQVQRFGCKFLQLMVYDETCKQKLVRLGAVAVVLNGLRRLPNDPHVATSTLDLVYFLSMELDGASDGLFSMLSAETIESVIESVLQAMEAHSHVQQVQANGVGILNNVVGHAQAKRAMCNSGSRIWEVVLGVFGCCSLPGTGASPSDGCEAASDAIELLIALLSDANTVGAVTVALRGVSTDNRTKAAYEHMCMGCSDRVPLASGDVSSVMLVLSVVASSMLPDTALFRRSRRSGPTWQRYQHSVELNTSSDGSTVSSAVAAPAMKASCLCIRHSEYSESLCPQKTTSPPLVNSSDPCCRLRFVP